MASNEQNFQLALTFDDVLLLPRKSQVLPKDVSLKSRLTRNIKLDIPILSAAMDTVTESKTAITLAKEGGVGIIHKNLTLSKQVEEVRIVKKYESFVVSNPIILNPDDMIADAIATMKKYDISGFPVVKDKKLVGILTNRDIRFETVTNKKVKDVMTSKNLITVKENTTIEDAQKLLHRHRIEKLLVVDNKYHLKGLITVKDIEKNLHFPNAAKDSFGSLIVGAAVGTGADGIGRTEALLEAGADVIVMDSAHGHSQKVLYTVKEIKRLFPKCELIAGNIGTADGCRALIDEGADAVKVGIGPGSICTTRIVAGVGIPQITAIIECSKIAKKHGVPVIADGGIKYSGDITKALAAGADSVMIGNLFAGTDESPGETVLFQGRTYKVYRGMGSIDAMREGGKNRYFQDDYEDTKFVPEGIEGRVPYRGPLSFSIHQLLGGVRSGMGYLGTKNIDELHKHAKFVRITNAGLKESHVHDVIITKEAPNYRIE
ncbi:MAG TPA: IMP dehydrogenase [bacterium]